MTRSVEQEEAKRVRAVEAAYDQAWKDGDLDALVACLGPSATLVNPRGQVASGTDEIREVLGAFLLGEARGSVHRTVVERVCFVGDDVAVVDGRALIELAPTSSAASRSYEHAFTDILAKTGDVWLIEHVRAYSLDATGL